MLINMQRVSHHTIRSATAAVSSGCILTFFASSNNNNNAHAESYPLVCENNDSCASVACERSVHKIPHPHCDSLSSSNNAYQSSSEMILASSPISITHSNNIQTKHLQEGKEKNDNDTNTIVCDYVIIGNGKAGQSAVRTIQQLEPTANVAIIDPNNNFVQNTDEDSTHGIAMKSNKRGGALFLKSKSSISGSARHLSTRASYIDHSKKLIHIHPITTQHNSPSANSNKTVVHYRKSALIATGSRGASPPESCIRQDARGRVLELRSTSLPTNSTQMQSVHQSAGQVSQAYSPSTALPVLDPPTVRSLSIMAATQSATVAIMGSGIEALELAAYCARVSSLKSASNQEKNSAQSNNKHHDTKKVLLLFGNSAPMSNQLPRYLSAAVSKRLRQNGIEVEERSMTRYISLANATDKTDVADSDGGKNALPKLEIYTVKSYDSLDSKQILADILVYAPSVEGVNGTSVIPTISNYSSTNHLPWSSLISPPMLTSYLDDGRIATNTEFLAASSIYAAGSVAKYPNARGQADVGGGRHVSAELVGEIAARNMVGGNVNNAQDPSSALPCYVQESIPVWRSDVVPYLPTSSTNNEGQSSTLALYSMGIHALCVGRCDSEVMATHGFWWTNTSSNSNNSETNDDNGKRSNNSNGSPNAFMRRATKRSNVARSTRGRGSLPVYGSGVVFYLNRSGNIEGIMLWGLPFSTNPNSVQSQLNNDLVERLKDMIRSNGGIAIQDHSEKIVSDNSGLNIDVNLLSYLHLVEESKYLASMALSGSLSELQNSRRVSVFGKPLHRYTPIKPFELTNLGKITRKDEMGYTTDENDMFYPSTVATAASSSPQQVNESGRPPSLKRIYPMQQGGTSALVGTEEYELEREMERRRLQIGRPPKEEPLWLRQGEENRFVNKRDALADAFARNIQRGVFVDGKDAVRQAPVPKVYSDAKEAWNKVWSDSEKEDGDVE